MVEVSRSVDIECAPAAAFALLNDDSRLAEWMTMLERHEVRYTAPEGDVGSTFLQTWDAGSVGSLEFEGEVVRYTRDRSLGLHLESKQANVDIQFELEGLSGKTRVTQTSTVAFKGMLKMMAGALGGKFSEQAGDHLERSLDRFRQLLEG